jgi:D-beta-D-heptose 7-phosphate kinase/D-beta-D-heptose 1-phosphate adenosyltransferase
MGLPTAAASHGVVSRADQMRAAPPADAEAPGAAEALSQLDRRESAMPFDIPGLVDHLSRGRVLVVGDVMLDRHVWGDVERVSPEAPIQVLGVGPGAEREEDAAGGAANVACKVAELGGRAVLAGVVGSDAEGRRLREATEAFGVDCSACVEDAARPTTLKTRYMARDQQLLRVDRESRTLVSGDVAAKLAGAIARELPTCDAVVIEDYGKGALVSGVLSAALARAAQVPVVVDPSGTDWSRYRGAAVITPNARELELAAGREARDFDDLVALARRLTDEAGVEAIATTRGSEGIAVVTRDAAEAVPTAPAEVYDVTGAGDAVAAVFALALAGGLELAEAAAVANVAGGLVIEQVGVGRIGRELLVEAAAGRHGAGKVVSSAQAAATARRLKAAGRKVVFTNGCFDLLHHGHVKLLHEARRQGDFLIVGLNSDESVRRIKGPGRPVLPERERSQVMGALGSVDLVVIFDEDTPSRLIEEIVPDVLVKGGDYEEPEIVGARFVRARGGEVVRVPLVQGASTSSIVERVKETDGAASSGQSRRPDRAEHAVRREWRDE